MCQDHFITFGSSRIHYCRWGTGSKLLLCLHGYGETAATFGFLEESLGQTFTMLAIDLPFHGATDWKEGLFLAPSDLLSLIRQLAAAVAGDDRPWWILGYSMGGRVALQILELAPEKIARLVLLAPDGLHRNPWYRLATRTRAGNSLFRWTMRHPRWFFAVLRLGNTLNLFNPSVYKFAAYYIGDPQVRQDLYTRWTTLRGFRPYLPRIQQIIRDRQLPVRILYGRFDRIIRKDNGEKFRAGGIGDHCQITILPAGHQLLQPANQSAILQALLD